MNNPLGRATSRQLLLAFLCIGLAHAACADNPSTRLDGGSAVGALAAWLESEHGEPAELAPILKYGQAVVASLSAALTEGPSPVRRERLRRSLETNYAAYRSAMQDRSPWPVPTQEQYVGRYLDNFDAMYRIRAAQALAAIGGQQARDAIARSISAEERGEVRTLLQELLAEIK
jgi:hypothetical protein